MLEKPDLPGDTLVAALQVYYGLAAVEAAFLPLGADKHTAVYLVTAADGARYFLKLRRGDFQEVTVTLPRYLAGCGIRQVIAPLVTRSGRLYLPCHRSPDQTGNSQTERDRRSGEGQASGWASVAQFTAILYPYIEGRNGYQAALSPEQWRSLGRGLKRIHSLKVPPSIGSRIPAEVYSPRWREAVRGILSPGSDAAPGDPVAEELRAFLEAKRAEILDLVGRAERLAGQLERRSPPFVLCHSDIHAGNVLIDQTGALYIVDWDNPIFAPKERDLMYPGAGLFGDGHRPQEEEQMFYEGYGPAQIDPAALAYYRYERIVEDIAEFCALIFSPQAGPEDRAQSLRYLEANFRPGGTIAIAREADRALV